MAINARIVERGNGFPDAGGYVPGDDGELYRIVRVNGRIHTAGSGNYIMAYLELADWDDVDTDDEVFPASAIIPK